MAKKVIVTLSNFGYWGEELVAPLEFMDAKGYEITFATHTGKKPVYLSVSADADWIDPTLGHTVTDAPMAVKVKALDASDRLDNPIKISDIDPTKYDAIFLVGGSGTLLDMNNNWHLQDVIREFVKADKPVGAICYGVGALGYTRGYDENGKIDPNKSIIFGKQVTGHPRRFDWKEGTGFAGTDLVIPGAPYPLEFVLRDAVGPNGAFLGDHPVEEISVHTDYPFVTGRSTMDSTETGRQFVEVVENSHAAPVA